MALRITSLCYFIWSKQQSNLQLHCSECAVVSNSGQLIGRNAGPEIDRSDCVIRMNDAPTLGFEADVGTRTTLRIISFATINSFNPKKLFNSSNSADTVVFWSPRQFMLTNGSGWVFNTLSTYKKNFSNVQFYINKPEKLEADHELYLKETRRHIGPIWETTGWFTMVFAMEVCDSISVYGMSQPKFCRTHPRDMTPYHYYNPRGQKECRQYRYHEKMNRNTHKYLLERDVFIRWSEWKTITFRHPTW
ncbi:alpha-N-acetylgalactosaminide alpha-2,6-sialyltransferase 5-like [Saccoglossus kowalevskii]